MKFLRYVSLWFCFGILLPVKIYCQIDSAGAESETQFFNAAIKTYGKQLTGVMAFQKESDEKYRVLFTTLAGPKLLDMYISTDSYEIIYCIKELNKKMILQFFQKDLSVLVGLPRNKPKKGQMQDSLLLETIPVLKKDTVFYYSQNSILKKEMYKSKEKYLFTVDYLYDNNKRMIEIRLEQLNFSMNINLKPLEL